MLRLLTASAKLFSSIRRKFDGFPSLPDFCSPCLFPRIRCTSGAALALSESTDVYLRKLLKDDLLMSLRGEEGLASSLACDLSLPNNDFLGLGGS